MNPVVKRVLCEPLVHFLVLGAGLFVLFGWWGSPTPMTGGAAGPPSTKIVVTQGDVEQLIARFGRTWQRPPSEAEVRGLVDDFIRDEIYYREALALGLDRGDALIRNRMRQRMLQLHGAVRQHDAGWAESWLRRW